MKTTKLFLTGALAIIGFMASSCGQSDEVNRQHLYNNASLVDSEGMTFFKVAHEKAAYELAQANQVLTQGVSGDAKAVAEQIVATYSELLPAMEELAAKNHVILPDPGALVFSNSVETDSTDSVAVTGVDVNNYVAHVQREHKELMNQFKRASRNTNKDVRSFGADHLAAIENIYAMAGGQVDEGAHH